MSKLKILAFAGSTREGSYNKKLVKNAVTMAEAAGAEVTYVDLRDYVFPLYDGDLEKNEGLPEKVKEFKTLMNSSDAFIISTPEYNGAISGILKNVIDWASRSAEGEETLQSFTGKVALVMSASPGALGGIRGLPIIRYILAGIGTLVIPSQVAFGKAADGFDEDGHIKDEKMKERVASAVKSLVETTEKLKS